MPRVKVCQTLIQPREIKVASESGPEIHTIVPSTIWTDAICSCPGFFYRGSCKHTEAAASLNCDFFTTPDDPQDHCPNCGSPLAEFETEPEFD